MRWKINSLKILVVFLVIVLLWVLWELTRTYLECKDGIKEACEILETFFLM
jgi:hypothetical protein